MFFDTLGDPVGLTATPADISNDDRPYRSKERQAVGNESAHAAPCPGAVSQGTPRS